MHVAAESGPVQPVLLSGAPQRAYCRRAAALAESAPHALPDVLHPIALLVLAGCRQQNNTLPDVVVLSGGSWYYPEKLTVDQLRQDLAQLEAAVVEADAAAKQASQTCLHSCQPQAEDLCRAPMRSCGPSSARDVARHCSAAHHPACWPALVLLLFRLAGACCGCCSPSPRGCVAAAGAAPGTPPPTLSHLIMRCCVPRACCTRAAP